MKLYFKLLIPLVTLYALLAPPAQAQITMTSTTFAAAVTDTGATQNVVTVSSATHLAPYGFLYADGETMQIQGSYVIASTTVPVRRGAGGRAVTHNTSSTVYVVQPGAEARLGFRNYDLAGSCTATSEFINPIVNTLNGNVWSCVASVWTAINGPATRGTGLSSLGPTTAGTIDIGAALLPFRKLYLGTAATNNMVITPAATSAARVITMADPGGAASIAYLNSTNAQTLTTTTKIGDSTGPTKLVAFDISGATAAKTSTLTFAHTNDRIITFPDAAITVSGATATDCGTSAGACSVTSTSATVKIVSGTAAATSASPSTVAITGMPAFTSTATYKCFASNATTPANVFSVLTAGYVSTTAVTFTGPNTLTDTIRWTCVGY
jgi:hypothetical protein